MPIPNSTYIYCLHNDFVIYQEKNKTISNTRQRANNTQKYSDKKRKQQIQV
jgi:hypothetical protein